MSDLHRIIDFLLCLESSINVRNMHLISTIIFREISFNLGIFHVKVPFPLT